MDKPGGEGASKHQMIDCYIQTLSKVLGSEEEAKKYIYNISCERYFGFGCEIDEETSNKLEGIPRVLFVLPDSYVDPEHKDYGGVDFKVKMVNIAGKKLKLAVWDTGASPLFLFFTLQFFLSFFLWLLILISPCPRLGFNRPRLTTPCFFIFPEPPHILLDIQHI
ncbi:hypothetical protein ZWY2020_058547 [Hordeum vulgare]|nr:hypothetical protein ZWY2020_058547 [Hordeum vulgare]